MSAINHRKRQAYISCASALWVLALLPSITLAAPINTFEDHLNKFIENNFSGQMSVSTTEIAKIQENTTDEEKRSLANSITENWWVINSEGNAFEQFSGEGRQDFVDAIFSKLTTGSVIASANWDWEGRKIQSYGAILPDNTGVGDTDHILEGISGFFFSESVSTLGVQNPFNISFKNGFGWKAASFSAELDCVGGDTCIGNASAIANLVFWSVDVRKRVNCLKNGDCTMDVAFIGTQGFPSVSFSAKDFAFKVSGFGRTFYKAELTLTEDCNCVPAPATLLLLLAGVSGLAYRSRPRKIAIISRINLISPRLGVSFG
jgi:hypothetical protein